MKKYILLCVGLCAVMAFTSCKSSESAYKKAYEKAKQYDTAQPAPAQQVNMVAPIQTRTVEETRVVDNLDNVSVRQENVALVSGTGLKAFSVVVGSFSVRANADGLQQRLRDAGYNAQIVRNAANNMYRVVASTFSDKLGAVNSRDQLRAIYPDAWLLYNAQ